MAQSVKAKAVNAEARVITEDFKFEVSEEKAEEILNAIMNSDCPIKKQIKEFCDACDEKGGFEKAKKQAIFDTYTLYILKKDVKLWNGAILKSPKNIEDTNDYDDLLDMENGNNVSFEDNTVTDPKHFARLENIYHDKF